MDPLGKCFFFFFFNFYQATTWASVDFASVRFCGIHLRAISLRVSKLSFCIISLKTVLLRLLQHHPGGNELIPIFYPLVPCLHMGYSNLLRIIGYLFDNPNLLPCPTDEIYLSIVLFLEKKGVLMCIFLHWRGTSLVFQTVYKVCGLLLINLENKASFNFLQQILWNPCF